MNLHYYNEADLETCRLNEVINYNKIIVSENIPPEDSCAKELYKDFVLFVKEDIKEDLSNIDQLYEAIDKALLINIDSNKFDLYKQDLEDKTTYLFTNSLINIIYSYLMNKKTRLIMVLK